MTGVTIAHGAPPSVRRVRVAVQGTVQGVGFRPFVYRLARASRLAGFVRNDSLGVVMEVEGPSPSIEHFLAQLTTRTPPHAHVTSVDVLDLAPRHQAAAFVVAPSTRGAAIAATIPADLATCDDCLRELFDPADRRYRYPFINCTACGPRFTIARALPYDRASTTMAAFAMCDACRAEYENPLARRFHAEPIACAQCGPRVVLRDGAAAVLEHADGAMVAAVRALRDGAVVAVKGLGGYHLAVRADDDTVVRRLRTRKARDAKPFAVMVRGTAEAARLATLSDDEVRLLTASARPIVLVQARRDAPVSPLVAPGRTELGLMLPYTPLHHLLLAGLDVPLVMTSGNGSDAPIAYRDDDALARLGGIADLFLTHDRAIEARCDDSVVRVVNVAGTSQPLFLRRSRGYVPQPLALPIESATPLLAVGGQLKNTACVARGSHAIVGPHGGDLDDWDAFSAYAAGVEHLQRLAGVTAHAVAHDLHPDYASTRYAASAAPHRSAGIQHHHAHLAACLAEHGLRGPALGLIFDGAGLGTDGTIWGGEILAGDLGSFTRLGHLRQVRMPGGDAAVREPWRMACAWLADAQGGAPPELPAALRSHVTDAQWARVRRLASSRAAPITSSVGRLLDACAALCAVAPRISYEGQAAIELEALARGIDAAALAPYPIAVDRIADRLILDPRELIRHVVSDVAARHPVRAIAARVHRGLLYAARLGVHLASQQTGLTTVVLSGGVFQNVLLLERLAALLAHDGLRVLVPRQLPPNDGGLSYGQAAVAAWREHTNVSGDSGSAR